MTTRRISVKKGQKGGWWVCQPGKKDTWHHFKKDAEYQKDAAIRVKRRRGQRKRRAENRGKR